jgi:uncharacterized RDD family membrane protein YckC
MENAVQETSVKPAKFWIRFCAGLIDLSVVVVFIVVGAEIAAFFGKYIPIELTVIITYAVYSAVSITRTGATVGKWLCGIKVTDRNGNIPRPVRSSVRAVFVALSQCLLGLPFLIVAARRTKRGWHDSIAGTQVSLLEECRIRRHWVVTAVSVGVIGYITVLAINTGNLYRNHRAWCSDADAAAEERGLRTDSPVEVSLLDASQRDDMAAWLEANSQDLGEYVVDLVSQHQVTIIGEEHNRKTYLAFLNRIIPDLYHKAGVRVIALECCHADQNEELANLISAKSFNRDAAINIARGAAWHSWGYKGYWDVLETVWKLNSTLSSEKELLQVVGIFPRLDLPSIALFKSGTWIERFRIARVILKGNLAPLIYADAFYANEIGRAIEKYGRTVVWVGAAHASLHSWHERTREGRVVARAHRMGSMIYGRYGEHVAQVVLHNRFMHPEIAKLIEQFTELNSQTEVAFDVENSPFARLRDSSSYYYRQPDRCLADWVSVYVFLGPMDTLERCEWVEDYISPRMFGQNKPFYEMACERELANNDEANRHMPNASF